jgi:hypothetical protein
VANPCAASQDVGVGVMSSAGGSVDLVAELVEIVSREPELDIGGWPMSIVGHHYWGMGNMDAAVAMPPSKLMTMLGDGTSFGLRSIMAVHDGKHWLLGPHNADLAAEVGGECTDDLQASAVAAFWACADARDPDGELGGLRRDHAPAWEDVLSALYRDMTAGQIDAWLRVGFTDDRPGATPERRDVPRWQASVPSDWESTVRPAWRVLMDHGEFLEGVEPPAPYALSLDDWCSEPAELYLVGHAFLQDPPLAQLPPWQRLRRAHAMSDLLTELVGTLVEAVAVWDAHLASAARPSRTVALSDWSQDSAGPDLPVDPDERQNRVKKRGAQRAMHRQAKSLVASTRDLVRVRDEIVAGCRPPDGPELDRLAEQMARTWQVREELSAWFR